MTAAPLVRAAADADRASIRAVHTTAFARDGEARLVAALGAAGKCAVSLVAIAGCEAVGHILFSPVAISGLAAGDSAVGLPPLAVLPAHQRRGIGARLVGEGLAACGRSGYAACVALGDPAYYRRCGFASARVFGLSSDYDAADAFMAIELRLGALAGAQGLCRYAEEFRSL